MPANAPLPARLALRSASALVAAVLVLLPAGGASASPPPAETLGAPVAADLSLSAVEGKAGDPVTLSGSCLLVDDVTGETLVRGDLLKVILTRDDGVDAFVWQIQAPVAEDGSVDVTFEVPGEVHPGTYRLGASCWNGDEGVGDRSFIFTVLASPDPTPPGPIDPPFFFVHSELELLPSSARAGDLVTLAGTCLLTEGVSGAVVLMGESLYVSLRAPGDSYETPFQATVPVGDDGAVELTFAVPDDLPPGTYTVFAMCTNDDQAFGGGDYELTVLAPPLPSKPATPVAPPAAVVPVAQPSEDAASSSPASPNSRPASATSSSSSADVAALAETGAPAARGTALMGLSLVVGGAGLLLARRRRIDA